MLNSTTRSSHTQWLGTTLVIELILTMITYKVDVIYSVASVLYSTCQFDAAPPSIISARTKHMSKNKNRKRKITIKLRTLQATKKIWFPSICFKFEKQEEKIDHFLYIAKWDSRLSPFYEISQSTFQIQICSMVSRQHLQTKGNTDTFPCQCKEFLWEGNSSRHQIYPRELGSIIQIARNNSARTTFHIANPSH